MPPKPWSKYLECEAWQIEETQKALQEAEAGDFATEAEADAVFSNWSEWAFAGRGPAGCPGAANSEQPAGLGPTSPRRSANRAGTMLEWLERAWTRLKALFC